MSEIRRRKIGAQNNNHKKENDKSDSTKINTVECGEGNYNLLAVFEVVFGLLIAVIVGYRYALYIKELHENDMWFSNIGVSIRDKMFSGKFILDILVIAWCSKAIVIGQKHLQRKQFE